VHDLIRQGAKLVSSVGDILEEFGPTAHSIEREKQLSLGDVAKNQESSFRQKVLKRSLCVVVQSHVVLTNWRADRYGDA
jgi:predicted Rossmann fold nucleotide-binding protein DprA/Smf involved in DNA uptake